MHEHYIENTFITPILICQTLCLMQLQTEKEIHAATSGCRLTIDHWGGESEALFSPSTNSQMWWFSRFWPELGSFCSSWEGSWPGPGAYPMPPHILTSGGGKGASCFPWSLSGSTKFGSTTHKPWPMALVLKENKKWWTELFCIICEWHLQLSIIFLQNLLHTGVSTTEMQSFSYPQKTSHILSFVSQIH